MFFNYSDLFLLWLVLKDVSSLIDLEVLEKDWDLENI